MRFIAPQFVQYGLPFLSFMVLSSYGLAHLIAPKMAETDRRKRYVPPEPAEEVLKKMQENLLKQEFQIVPTPGSRSVNLEGMSRAQLQMELENLREAEEWTGLPMRKQKLAVKQLLKAKAKEP